MLASFFSRNRKMQNAAVCQVRAPDFSERTVFRHSSQGGSGSKRAARKSMRLRTFAEGCFAGG
jgi:hypothetical protein